jgi:hypothetical protein
MATLPQITLNFNRQIKLSNDGGSLSSDTGDFTMDRRNLLDVLDVKIDHQNELPRKC